MHQITFKHAVTSAAFSPDGKYIAVAQGNHVQVWVTPSMIVRQFAPFELHREYTGHQGEVQSIVWSKTSRYVSSGSQVLLGRQLHVEKMREG
jgi:periodic tryptophan protein 2